MQDVQPLEAYRDDSISWLRVGVLAGGFFGLGMTVLFLVMGLLMTAWTTRPRGFIVALVVQTGLGAGVLFGVLFALLFRWMIRRMTVRAFNGAAPFQVSAPGGEYTHRLPASLRVSDAMAVGGVVFFSPATIAFVPHTRNLARYRHTVLIAIDRQLRVSTVPQALTALRKLTFKSLPPLLRITTGEGEWRFLVPRPHDTAGKLRRILVER